MVFKGHMDNNYKKHYNYQIKQIFYWIILLNININLLKVIF